MTSAITAAAAVAAAFFSILNVVLSNRYARTTQVQQWRRESARKTFLDLLDATGKALDAHLKLAILNDPKHKSAGPPDVPPEIEEGFAEAFAQAQNDKTVEIWTNAASAVEKVLYRLSELELAASAECVKAGRRLVYTVDKGMPSTVRHDDGEAGKTDAFMAHVAVYDKARQEFVLACRRDLGVGRGMKTDPI